MSTVNPETSKMNSININWDNTSPWANPHFSTLYSQPVRFENEEAGLAQTVEFHVADRGCYGNPDHRLVARVITYREGQEIDYSWLDLGSFVDTIDNELACRNVKRYAQYAIDGYAESWSFQHCPSFEIIDDVDRSFNPI